MRNGKTSNTSSAYEYSRGRERDSNHHVTGTISAAIGYVSARHEQTDKRRFDRDVKPKGGCAKRHCFFLHKWRLRWHGGC